MSIHDLNMTLAGKDEHSACGVGFLASRIGHYSHEHLKRGLHALCCVEHRGACHVDGRTGDGSGIMTDIPFELLGYERGEVALATLFVNPEPVNIRRSLQCFEETFLFYGLHIIEYREVPVDPSVLGEESLRSLPSIMHAIIRRPVHCRTDASFDRLLYQAHRHTLSRLRERESQPSLFFPSLSATTVVYKALVRSDLLEQFYLDLQNPEFKTRFVMFHRRFSTNTVSSWDKVQPFRLIGHNGEFNTIRGNRSWSISREKSLGLRAGELLTRAGISDSGSFNEMVEGLLFRSSIPRVEEVLAIMMPPARSGHAFYQFWSRAMEPWDGPAFVTFSDGHTLGARLDRNGFRPCRWALTKEHLFLASETGVFELDESLILEKGSLEAGSGTKIDLDSGKVSTKDPSLALENKGAAFDARLIPLPEHSTPASASVLHKMPLFGYTDEDLKNILIPMIQEGKEPIGSMGDTARPAIFSDVPRSFFDYFYQTFAQVTNPPLDYIREEIVTDLATHLGSRPNIFATKELIPPKTGYLLPGPILSLRQMEQLHEWERGGGATDTTNKVKRLNICFARQHGVVGLRAALKDVAQKAVDSTKQGFSILILSDRDATVESLPVPSLLMLRAVINALNDSGLRLETSVIVETCEAKNTHDVAALIGFGATAVCPNLALELARFSNHSKLKELSPDQREENLRVALEHGLLKIMAKMGISVVRSYQSAKLFLALGLSNQVVKDYFPGIKSPLGGLGLKELTEQLLLRTEDVVLEPGSSLLRTYQFKEHNRGLKGEKHAMTNTLSKLIHRLVRGEEDAAVSLEIYQEYLREADASRPLHIRDLFALRPATTPFSKNAVQSRASIMRTFGSGAMSFGAISAESQRDLILAMRAIGGRSNSGEGGENPFYYTEGLTCSVKQLASGRFGVTAEYLVCGDEIQIKIAQGAKPGEGGQLMASKVDETIARARHAKPHVELISPPPLHDIYSIEDLKQLIYELKQLKPDASVSVKLVSGAGIGTIAMGVAKAGADVIHIAGGDGGTGAASLMSMKHAGLPWELGLMEVHRALVDNHLRSRVRLRVDGGLHRGKDILLAAILGAEEFDFGKLLLIAEGCVMARICEKNTCPTGIATHDPKFKAKYKGTSEHVVRLMELLAEDVREQLSSMGVVSLASIQGRVDLLEIEAQHEVLLKERGVDLSFFIQQARPVPSRINTTPKEEVNDLNQRILQLCAPALRGERRVSETLSISSTDRAALATLSGVIAMRRYEERLHSIKSDAHTNNVPMLFPMQMTFEGSAGQGFGVFLVDGLELRLIGEANDSVCKGMNGGKVVIHPHPNAPFDWGDNTIIGNCALYGATGGTLFVYGVAGDRFAVRNSGAIAVVEGTGLHACEYMTDGCVVILGSHSANMGAGMTGGIVFVYEAEPEKINADYLFSCPMKPAEEELLLTLLNDYHDETNSRRASEVLKHWERCKNRFSMWLPINLQKERKSEEVAA